MDTFTVFTMDCMRSAVFNDGSTRICRSQINSYRNHSTKLMKNQVFGSTKKKINIVTYSEETDNDDA